MAPSGMVVCAAENHNGTVDNGATSGWGRDGAGQSGPADNWRPETAMSYPSSSYGPREDLFLNVQSMAANALKRFRLALGVTGAASVILGLLVLFWPGATLDLVAVLFGLYFVISGGIRIISGLIMPLGAGLKTLNIVVGVLLFIVGVVAIRNPLASLAVLGMVIGIAWIVEGVLALTEIESGGSRWYAITYGIVSLLAGVVVLLLPIDSLAALVIFGGIFLLVLGIVELVRALTFGRGVARTV